MNSDAIAAPILELSAVYPRVKVVRSFEELISTPLEGQLNALCWPRELPGNFREVATLVEGQPGIVAIEESDLFALSLSSEGCVARNVMLRDLELLRDADLFPVLDCITGSQREPAEGAFATDVYSYHADSATAVADTYLCTYTGACSEGLRNDEAIRRVDIPETRAELLALYGGGDDEGFREFLNDNFYDLHYLPLPHGRPFSLGLHNLWRIALAHPGSLVPPCIHRAPITLPGMPSRLLMLS